MLKTTLFLGKILGIFNDRLNIVTCQNLHISLELYFRLKILFQDF